MEPEKLNCFTFKDEPTLSGNESEKPIDRTPSKSVANKNIKRKRDDDVLQKAIAELNKTNDDFDTFGEFVASEVRNLHYDHNRRKLKRIIQKAILDISEMDDNEMNASAFPSRSQTSMSFIESDASNYSVHSPPQTLQPIHYQSQSTHSPFIAQPSTSCTSASSRSSQNHRERGK